MFKDKKTKIIVIVVIFLILLYLCIVFSVVEILIIIAVSVVFVSMVFPGWYISRNMPDLDNPKNLKNYTIVTKDFEQIGDHFEGLIKLNGVQWKAKKQFISLQAWICSDNEIT
jgi:c-di-AMP phosphodiesterase-like protein